MLTSDIGTSYSSKERSVIHFKPKKSEYYRKLDPVESYLANRYVANSFIFKSEIDIPRIVMPSIEVSKSSIMLPSTVSYSGKDKIASYSKNTTTTLEVEYRDSSLESFLENNKYRHSLSDLLPEDFKKTRMIVGGLVEDVPMASFKIIQCQDFFTFGYHMSHIFFDQASIVYLFKYLSALYHDETPLAEPVLINFDDQIDTENPLILRNVKELRDKARHFGFSYMPDKKEFYEMLSRDLTNQTMKLTFSKKVLEEFRSQ